MHRANQARCYKRLQHDNICIQLYSCGREQSHGASKLFDALLLCCNFVVPSDMAFVLDIMPVIGACCLRIRSATTRGMPQVPVRESPRGLHVNAKATHPTRYAFWILNTFVSTCFTCCAELRLRVFPSSSFRRFTSRYTSWNASEMSSPPSEADVSKKAHANSVATLSPSAIVTHRWCCRSALFATSTHDTLRARRWSSSSRLMAGTASKLRRSVAL